MRSSWAPILNKICLTIWSAHISLGSSCLWCSSLLDQIFLWKSKFRSYFIRFAYVKTSSCLHVMACPCTTMLLYDSKAITNESCNVALVYCCGIQQIALQKMRLHSKDLILPLLSYAAHPTLQHWYPTLASGHPYTLINCNLYVWQYSDTTLEARGQILKNIG